MKNSGDNLDFNKILDTYNECKEFLCAYEIMSDYKLYTHYLSTANKLENIANMINLYNEENSNNKDLIYGAIKSQINNLTSKKQIAIIELTTNNSNNIDIVSTIFTNFIKKNKFELLECEKNANKQCKIILSGENVYDNLKNLSGQIVINNGKNETNILCTILEKPNYPKQLNKDDIIMNISRSSGAGGQHINTTDSAIQLIHTPTQIIVTCQDERSQLQNKNKAMKILEERVNKYYLDKTNEYENNQRKLLKQNNFNNQKVLTINLENKTVICNGVNLDHKKIFDGEIGEIINLLQ